jgi:hypothetical protein
MLHVYSHFVEIETNRLFATPRVKKTSRLSSVSRRSTGALDCNIGLAIPNGEARKLVQAIVVQANSATKNLAARQKQKPRVKIKIQFVGFSIAAPEPPGTVTKPDLVNSRVVRNVFHI